MPCPSHEARLGLFRDGDLIRAERVAPIRTDAEHNGWHFEPRQDGDFTLRRNRA